MAAATTLLLCGGGVAQADGVQSAVPCRSDEPIVPARSLGGGVVRAIAAELRLLPAETHRFYAVMVVQRADSAALGPITGIVDFRTTPPSFSRTPDLDDWEPSREACAVSLTGDALGLVVGTPQSAVYSVRSDVASRFPAFRPLLAPAGAESEPALAQLAAGESVVYLEGGGLWSARFARDAYRRGECPLSERHELVARPPRPAGLHFPRALPDGAGTARAFLLAPRAGTRGAPTAAGETWIHAIGVRAAATGPQVFSVSSVAVPPGDETIAVVCPAEGSEHISGFALDVIWSLPREDEPFIATLPATIATADFGGRDVRALRPGSGVAAQLELPRGTPCHLRAILIGH
jgi:hypothetical protein